MPTQSDAPSALLKPEGASLAPGSARSLLMTDSRRTGLADGPAGVDVGAAVRAQGTRRGGAGRTAGHRARGGLRLDGPRTKRTRSQLVARAQDDQDHRVRRPAGLLPERSLQQLGWHLAGHSGDDPAIPPQRPAAAVLRPDLGRARQPRPRALAGPACRTGGRGRQADRRARPAPAHRSPSSARSTTSGCPRPTSSRRAGTSVPCTSTTSRYGTRSPTSPPRAAMRSCSPTCG